MILDVALFALDLPETVVGALARLLDPAERDRAARFRFDRDWRRFVARRGQLRLLLAQHASRPAQTLQFTANSFGKPALANMSFPDPLSSGEIETRHDRARGVSIGLDTSGIGRSNAKLAFNLSSSADVALCVVARGVEVGCDVERRDAALADPAVAARLFAPAECAALSALPAQAWAAGFFDCWTRKEAFVKALGTGLSHPLRDFAVTIAPDEPARVLDPAAGWSLHGFAPLPGYHAAVAVPLEGVAWPGVRWFAAQDALASSVWSSPPSSVAWSPGSARFAAESSISAALLS